MDTRRLMKRTAALLAAASLITPSLGQQRQPPPDEQQQQQLQKEEAARQAAQAAAAKAKHNPIVVIDKVLDPAGAGPAIQKGLQNGVGDIERGLGSSAARRIPRTGYNADGTRQRGPGPDPDKPKLEGSPPK